MNNLDFYLTYDHPARQRVMFISVAIGVFVGGLAQFLGVPLRDAVVVCVLAVGIGEIGGALRYRAPDRKEQRVVAPLLARRYLIHAAVAAAGLAAVTMLRLLVPRAVLQTLQAQAHVQTELETAKREARAGKIDDANKHVQEASEVIEKFKTSRVPASPSFFNSATSKLGQLRRAGVHTEDVHNALVQLAEYRSAIRTRFSFTEAHIGNMERRGEFLYIKDSYLKGPTALATSAGRTGLDYLILDNVTFENADIYYQGGPVALHNVYFLDCRFHVPDSSRGDDLLTAAIEQPANARIGV
jgi:hypothetical protein